METGKNTKGIFRVEVKATEWTFDKMKEAFEQVAQDEPEKLSIVKDIMVRSGLPARVIAPAGGQGGVAMSYLCPNCNSFPLEEYIWCVSGKKEQQLVVRDLWREIQWEAAKQAFGRTTGDSTEQAKVFKAHAVPQGLCINLVSALKLLAYQQEDGDGLLQNIVTNLGKESRKGLTDGLREFIKIDNERALENGYLNWGMGTFKVRKPKVPEGMPGGNGQGKLG